ncbi:thioredoxin-like protein [Lentinula lateritia]|nr:thioredoxin-like protein [Lentinula lateritia]
MSRVSLEIGSTAPNFEGHTAQGPLKFHQWAGESWSIVFTHPGSSFSKELNEIARRLLDIEQRRVKIIGLSRNWPDESSHWTKLLQHYNRQLGSSRDVQIIADDQGTLSSLYGMLSQRDSNGVASNPNTAFLMDPMKNIRLVLSYPSFLSTGLTQILRYIFLCCSQVFT